MQCVCVCAFVCVVAYVHARTCLLSVYMPLLRVSHFPHPRIPTLALPPTLPPRSFCLQVCELVGPPPPECVLGGERSDAAFNSRGELRRIKELRYWGPASVLCDKYRWPPIEVRGRRHGGVCVCVRVCE